MAMHKGMCGRTESNNVPASTPFGEKTLGDYLVKKYPEEMKKKLTFEEWFTLAHPAWRQGVYRADDFDAFSVYDLRDCWKAAQQNV